VANTRPPQRADREELYSPGADPARETCASGLASSVGQRIHPLSPEGSARPTPAESDAPMSSLRMAGDHHQLSHRSPVSSNIPAPPGPGLDHSPSLDSLRAKMLTSVIICSLYVDNIETTVEIFAVAVKIRQSSPVHTPPTLRLIPQIPQRGRSLGLRSLNVGIQPQRPGERPVPTDP
jgi:hypothetical protein